MLSTILFDPRLTPAAAALIGAVIGLSGTLLVTIVNGLIGRNRHRREKIWERRQEACSEIVGALRAAKPLADRIYEGFADNPHRYYESDDLKVANKRYWEAIGKADSSFKANYLILPTAFRARYERLTAERSAWDYDVGPDVYLGEIGANEAATTDLMDIALASLGIVPWWHRTAIFLRLSLRLITRALSKVGAKARRRWRTWRRRKDSDDGDV